jgi:OOP family OmpA-OmpF porin
MDTAIPMQPSSLIEGLKALITPDVVAKVSTTYGESEAAVSKGLGVALPTVLGALASKSNDRSFMTRAFALVKDPSSEGGILSNVAGLFSSGGSGLPGMNLGSRLMLMLFGSNTNSLGNALSSFAGVRASTASSMLALAGPLAVGYLGRTVRTEGLDESGFANMLAEEKSSIMRMVPTSISNLFSGGSQIAAVGYRPTREPVQKASPLWWVFLALIAVVAFWALSALFANRNRVMETGNKVINSATSFLSRTLPGGAQLRYLKGGIEGKLIAFIEDPTQPASKEAWFDFDRLLFETNSAVLKPESTEQIANIAAILKAYPNVNIKVGGYTDNAGDPAANVGLSRDRANSVMQALIGLGVAPNRITADGYGETHPVADNSTEAGRALNRRVAVRVTQK